MTIASIGAAIRRAAAATGRATPVLARDLSGLAGAGLISYGAWLVYVPAGFMTAGVLLVVAAFLLGGRR